MGSPRRLSIDRTSRLAKSPSPDFFSRRLTDEAAFLPAALSLQDTPVHSAPRRFAYAVMALFIIALLWAIFGKIDIVAVAQGRIVESERTKLVQPLERSVVQRIPGCVEAATCRRARSCARSARWA